jgi:hypothetical protein
MNGKMDRPVIGARVDQLNPNPVVDDDEVKKQSKFCPSNPDITFTSFHSTQCYQLNMHYN